MKWTIGDDAIGPTKLSHRLIDPERNRQQQSLVAEADIAKITLARDVDREEHVSAWRDFLRSHPHSSREPRDTKADLLQRSSEQRVLLEAIATSTSLNQFGREAFEIEPDWFTHQHVEIFEGDMRRMREVERL